MGAPAGRFAAILWDISADVEDAIDLVQRFEEPGDAVDLLTTRCAADQSWAVVDLSDRRIMYRGPGAVTVAPRQ